MLDAYTAGVNAGLAALGAHPFEYLVLRQTPRPWREEDTFLVVLSMFVTLQDTEGAYESTLATMRDVLPAPMFDFLAPPGTEWDAPMIGPAFAMPSVPGPRNLRPKSSTGWKATDRPAAALAGRSAHRCSSGLLRVWMGVGHQRPSRGRWQ